MQLWSRMIYFVNHITVWKSNLNWCKRRLKKMCKLHLSDMCVQKSLNETCTTFQKILGWCLLSLSYFHIYWSVFSPLISDKDKIQHRNWQSKITIYLVLISLCLHLNTCMYAFLQFFLYLPSNAIFGSFQFIKWQKSFKFP